MVAWGARINLTGHRTAEAVARRLVLDAAALSAQLPAAATIVDLGSGAGFPGLPMAVLRPAGRVVLVEARQRRHHFQRQAIRTLELENAEAVLGRFEGLQVRPSDLVVAQAVGPSGEVASAMLAWASRGGLIAIPGGESPPEPRLEGVEDVRLLGYRVPLGGPQRTIWTARRA